MPTWLIVVIVVAVLAIVGNVIGYAERRRKVTVAQRTEQFLKRNTRPKKIADWYLRIRGQEDFEDARDEALNLIMSSNTQNAVEAQGMIREQLEWESVRQRWLKENYGSLQFPLAGWGIGSHRMPPMCCRCGGGGR